MELTPLLVALIGVLGGVAGVLLKFFLDQWTGNKNTSSAKTVLYHETFLFCNLVNSAAILSRNTTGSNLERLTDTHREELKYLRIKSRDLDGEISIGLMNLHQAFENLDSRVADLTDPINPSKPVKESKAYSRIERASRLLEAISDSMAKYCIKRLPFSLKLQMRKMRYFKKISRNRFPLPSMAFDS